jgi:type VI secretion system protein ImpK
LSTRQIMNPEMQTRHAEEAKEATDSPHPSENLALLYQGLLTGIVRMQAGKQRISDGEAFRRRTKAALQAVERDATAAGYDGDDIRDTHFAVVAFLDSVVLHSNDPARAEWERKTLQEELFGQAVAGVVFFENLERFRARRDSERLADILEVYLLCVLLGFEGRFSGGLRGELDAISETLRRRIDDIRGRSRQISPAGGLPSEPALAEAHKPQQFHRFRLITLGAVGFTLLLFLLLKFYLISSSDQLGSKLLGLQ